MKNYLTVRKEAHALVEADSIVEAAMNFAEMFNCDDEAIDALQTAALDFTQAIDEAKKYAMDKSGEEFDRGAYALDISLFALALVRVRPASDVLKRQALQKAQPSKKTRRKGVA